MSTPPPRDVRATYWCHPESLGVETEDGVVLFVFSSRAKLRAYCDGAGEPWSRVARHDMVSRRLSVFLDDAASAGLVGLVLDPPPPGSVETEDGTLGEVEYLQIERGSSEEPRQVPARFMIPPSVAVQAATAAGVFHSSADPESPLTQLGQTLDDWTLPVSQVTMHPEDFRDVLTLDGHMSQAEADQVLANMEREAPEAEAPPEEAELDIGFGGDSP